ncbi:M28 family metallopeptidase [Marinoscillum sp. MHG1-6]|uniref:M28 family metallopeptidase n=1 Tax=Marinoscillum sp. MHG1-6 TaxID=2959627 RepID=UPI0021577A44|nr:M28 family metallopeptidase [Marinoscillum sp. MHG1-6]
MQKYLYILLAASFIYGCQQPSENQSSTSIIDTLSIAKHIEVLASDDFLGRKPFTEGEVKTLAYLKGEFEKYGLQPGNGDSFFQEVPLVELDCKPSSELIIEGGQEPLSLEWRSEFVSFTERVEEKVTLESSELVFAGFGIVAPEYGWNDYEGLDVEGKTVIVLVNDPGFGSEDSTFFKGETMTYYGRWTYKYEEAARQGAAGIFIVHQTAPAGYPWNVVQNGWSGASLFLDQAEGGYQPAIQGWVTRDAAIKIFEASEVDMRNFVEKARSKDFKPVSLGLTASTFVENGIKKDVSQNVIAKIEGTERPDEVIIYTAHWDHLGVGPVVDGDSIYNGAHDNASGVASMLCIAAAFANQEVKPKRSLVFLAVTAEEQGLLGSKYYSANPVYPTSKTVANINMDGMYYMGLMKDLTVIGYGQSELEDIAGGLAAEQGRYLYPDSEPEKGFFFRSDHFQFAKVGIPAFYAYGAYEAVDGGVAYAKEVRDAYNVEAYHLPADEFTLEETDWKMAGMQQDVELFYELGKVLGNSEDWPEWKEGSEFKSIRDAEMGH